MPSEGGRQLSLVKFALCERVDTRNAEGREHPVELGERWLGALFDATQAARGDARGAGETNGVETGIEPSQTESAAERGAGVGCVSPM